MNADGSRGVDVRADVGAKVPALEWISLGLLAGGLRLAGIELSRLAPPAGRKGRSTAHIGTIGPSGQACGVAECQ